jgi:hypothetical protein
MISQSLASIVQGQVLPDLRRLGLRLSDDTVAGNSMASRLANLVDPETSKASEGAIEIHQPIQPDPPLSNESELSG